jgi:uncharacterized membrane protein YsdA (DUF1294 family)
MTTFGQVLMGLLVAVNLAGFLAFGYDKLKAKRGTWRVPEKSLVLFAVCGGWLGTWLGLKLFRHKSSKRSFQVKLALGTALNVLAWVLAWRLHLLDELPSIWAG